MTKYTEKIVDVTTGEETVRELTKEEIAELVKEQKTLDERSAVRKAEIDARISQRLAILTKLGLTEEEAALLLS
jgi:hypothetical protein